MRSILDELTQELKDIETLLKSLTPVSEALASHGSPVVQQYITIRRRFDYASFIVALYASFEKFSENLVASFVRLATQRTPYMDLPKKMKEKHESKSAEMLHRGRLGQGRHLGVTPLDVVKNLFECMSGANPYKLNETALITHDLNLRQNELNDLFRSIGIDDVVAKARQCDALRAWYRSQNNMADDEAIELPATSVEGALEELVERRNEVAHRGGSPDNLLGIEEMDALLKFIGGLSESIYAVATTEYLRQKYYGEKDSFSIKRIGRPLKDGHVVIAEGPDYRIFVGQAAFSMSEIGVARWGRINNLQIDGNDISELSASSGVKSIGISTDFRNSKSSVLRVLQQEDDAIWPQLALQVTQS